MIGLHDVLSVVSYVVFAVSLGSTGPASGVALSLSPADNLSRKSVTTPDTANFNSGTSLTVIAPATAPNGYVFSYWSRNSVSVSTSASYTFSVRATITLTAVYIVPKPTPSGTPALR